MDLCTEIPKSGLSWRLFDLLRVQSSPANSRNRPKANAKAAPDQPQSVFKCACCGTYVLCKDESTKFTCSLCHTTNLGTTFALNTSAETPELISLIRVKTLVAQCLAGPKAKSSHELHQQLRPILDYLTAAFSDMMCVNRSFCIRQSNKRAHYSSSNLAAAEIRETFELLAQLPSKKPLYCALQGASNCLKRLPLGLCDSPLNLHWVLVLFEIPFLHKALLNADSKSERGHRKSMTEEPQIQALCYDILKRTLGIISQAKGTLIESYLASWFLKYLQEQFVFKVDLFNLYITFQLKRHFYFANNPHLSRRPSSVDAGLSEEPHNVSKPAHGRHPDEYHEFSYLKDEVELSHAEPSLWSRMGRSITKTPSKRKKTDSKIRYHQYKHDYHLRTAMSVMAIFVTANSIRHPATRIPVHCFYNSLVDFVGIRSDFDFWLTKRKATKSAPEATTPPLQTVIDYVHGKSDSFMAFDSQTTETLFCLCQYPFILSLGAKISLLEHEARRSMERKAEEAFINSLDQRIIFDVYFKVRVRRDFIVEDSLLCIQLNQANLKKSLKVQFINEPGIDAGGLKKEWFLLLTKAIFSPKAGMFYNVEDSNLLWFNILPNNNFELYYLLGAVLGLAIYNLTILDLALPLAMYKILLGKSLGLLDYQEIFPEAAKYLFQLRLYNAEELSELGLAFDVTFSDTRGQRHVRELIENGLEVEVDMHNREVYIDKYAAFFTTEAIARQVTAFRNGFCSVVDGNALSLFLPEEIQLLLCGSEQETLDIDVLKSVTSYVGWETAQAALELDAVKWFWEFMWQSCFKQQKQVLQFITGSDRVPATGLQNFQLKISRLKSGEDSEHLPIAHTCFNELAIYEYSSREKLHKKLHQAVHMLAGFGIK